MKVLTPPTNPSPPPTPPTPPAEPAPEVHQEPSFLDRFISSARDSLPATGAGALTGLLSAAMGPTGGMISGSAAFAAVGTYTGARRGLEEGVPAAVLQGGKGLLSGAFYGTGVGFMGYLAGEVLGAVTRSRVVGTLVSMATSAGIGAYLGVRHFSPSPLENPVEESKEKSADPPPAPPRVAPPKAPVLNAPVDTSEQKESPAPRTLPPPPKAS